MKDQTGYASKVNTVAGYEHERMLQGRRRNEQIHITNKQATSTQITPNPSEASQDYAGDGKHRRDSQKRSKAPLLNLWIAPSIDTLIYFPVSDGTNSNTVRAQ